MSDNESVDSSASSNESAKKSGPSHPPYLPMVMDAVQSQQTRSAGVSRPKIVQFIKSKYKLEEVNATALKNAIKKALEKDQLESKTGTGMNGTFVLSKTEKLKAAKEEKKKQKAEAKTAEQGSVSESEVKPKPKAKKVTKPTSKDDIDLETEKKKAKKPPVVPKAKGKENNPKWKKGDPVRKPSVLQAKVKQMTKSASAGDILEPQPSTSKQRATKTKGGK